MPIQMGDTYLDARPVGRYSREIGVCILAAGIAKRLEPISGIIAKPAFPLGGKVPIVELLVRKFVEAGITKMAMNLHRVPESIRRHFGDGKKFLADIAYVEEEIPTGTLGGAIKMVRALQGQGFYPERVFIPSGDIVSGIGMEHLKSMIEHHSKRGAAVTMVLAPIPWKRRGDFGTAILEGIPARKSVPNGTYARILDFVEKDPQSPSNENNASNYLIETDFLLELETYLTPAQPGMKKPCYDFGKHVFMGMIGRVPHLKFLTRRRSDLYGYEPGTIWFDVGNKRDYLEVNKAVLNGAIELNLPYAQHPWGWMGENVEIDFSRVKINPPIVIGNNCTIFPEAEIGPNVVLGDGWTCHRGAKIKDAVLWPHYDFSAPSINPTPRMSRVREIREGVAIDTAIIVGGIVGSDIRAKTVDLRPNGDLNIRSIDWVPTEERA
jgi:mannose-1-phosphate guanylyltransferase / phosphomannomutase